MAWQDLDENQRAFVTMYGYLVALGLAAALCIALAVTVAEAVDARIKSTPPAQPACACGPGAGR